MRERVCGCVLWLLFLDKEETAVGLLQHIANINKAMIIHRGL